MKGISLTYHTNIGHSVNMLMTQLYASVAEDMLAAGIDIHAPIKTIDGDHVRLIAYDGDHRYPLVGEVIDVAAGVGWLARWSRGGRYFGTTEATNKHSMAPNVTPAVKPATATSTGRFSGEVPNRSNASSLKPVDLDKEPVHDMGVETEESGFVSIHGAGDEFDRLAELYTRLEYYRNQPPPTIPANMSAVAASKYAAGHFNNESRRVRAFRKLLAYAEFGRFRWYAHSHQRLPLVAVERIVEALDQTDYPFLYLRSPDATQGGNAGWQQAVGFAGKHGGLGAVSASVRAALGKKYDALAKS